MRQSVLVRKAVTGNWPCISCHWQRRQLLFIESVWLNADVYGCIAIAHGHCETVWCDYLWFCSTDCEQEACFKNQSFISQYLDVVTVSSFGLFISENLLPWTEERDKRSKEPTCPHISTHTVYTVIYSVYVYHIYIYIYMSMFVNTHLSVRLCTTVLVCMHALLSDWRQAADVICCSAAISACEMLGLEFVYLVNWTYTESHVITFRMFSRSFIYFLVPVYHI